MKYVKNYESLFSITEDGKLFSHRGKTIRKLKLQLHPTGYLMYGTKIGGRKGQPILLRIHRLVAEAFVHNPDNKPFVNHVDGNKLNNCVTNLEWVTAQENSRHAWDTGLQKPLKGVEYAQSKLSDEDVLYIRANFKPYDKLLGARALAKRFNISNPQITRVVQGKTYKDVG
jgi:hypothetical protein